MSLTIDSVNQTLNLQVKQFPPSPNSLVPYLLFFLTFSSVLHRTAHFLLFWLIPKICTILTKILIKSSSRLILSFTASLLTNPLSASLAWCKIFCTSYSVNPPNTASPPHSQMFSVTASVRVAVAGRTRGAKPETATSATPARRGPPR